MDKKLSFNMEALNSLTKSLNNISIPDIPVIESPMCKIAESSEIQVEALKTIVAVLEEQNKRNEEQERENKTLKVWTIVGVVIMAVTLIATIIGIVLTCLNG